MTSKEFLQSYRTSINVRTSDEDRLRIVRQLLQVTTYISYDKKCEIVEDLLLKYGKNAYARIQKRFIECMLRHYTNLEIIDDTYDILEETDTLRFIITLFQIEYERCAQILNMYLDDLQSGRISYENLLSTD